MTTFKKKHVHSVHCSPWLPLYPRPRPWVCSPRRDSWAWAAWSPCRPAAFGTRHPDNRQWEYPNPNKLKLALLSSSRPTLLPPRFLASSISEQSSSSATGAKLRRTRDWKHWTCAEAESLSFTLHNVGMHRKLCKTLVSNLVNVSREAHNYKPLSVSVLLQFCFEHINNHCLREE